MPNRLPIVLAAMASLGFALAGCEQRTRVQTDLDRGWVAFGTALPTTPETDPEVTVETLGPFVDSERFVVLSGTVAEVCRTMGCWLEIEGDSGERILVLNRDHAFFIPRNATGRRVHAMGWAYTDEQSVETLRHLALDAGRTPEEIETIVEPVVRTVFIANAIVLPPGGLEAPVEPLPAETELPPADDSMTPGAMPEEAEGASEPAPVEDAELEDLP